MGRIMSEKRGWIRIVEAFVAILLITGVVLILVGEGNIKNNSESKIYTEQGYILQKIQSNDTLRTEVLNATSLPKEWNAPDFPPSIKGLINFEKPGYAECEGKICSIEDNCILSEKETEVYARDILITSNLTFYSPRKLKLFCWEN
jgi:hypothetical protein